MADTPAAPVTEGLVILAGGISSRMARSLAGTPGSVDRHIAKGMIGLGEEGRPFLDYLLLNAAEAGLRDVVIVVSDRDDSIRAAYGPQDRDNDFHDLRVSYAVQRIPADRRKPLGTADALLQALRARPDWHGRHFLVCNSDNLYSTRAMRLLLALGDSGGWIDYDVRGLRFSDERIAQFGITGKDDEGFLTRIMEKPSLEELARERAAAGTVRVSMNLWRLPYDLVLPALEECPLHPLRDEKELPVAIGLMIARHPRSLRAVPLSEHVPDLTSAEDFDDVRAYLQERYGRDRGQVEGDRLKGTG
ncbi:MAG: NTP transferase domain-containing protein [Ignavibacteria bacterium]|nr:NTP transferase domain-containing protein [Ignavibacteria bacterium]